ncbi:MAG: hypothetical protein LC650_02985 [Actinobacteria bacterium]|nr:hypothetical protein [Actinomycetota bacterium]
MGFTWTGTPLQVPPDLTNTDYAIWKFRQKAGLSHQDETYEAALSDESIVDMMVVDNLVLKYIVYHQPLITLARFIMTDPEQRTESQEGDAKDKWTDPFRRAQALLDEQEALNRSLIPDYIPAYKFFKPVLTDWRT